MKREELLSKIEYSMFVIGKEMHEQLLGSSGVSQAQQYVLVVIGLHDNIGIKQLAKILCVTSGAVSQHVDVLENNGLVSRKINPEERREIIVFLTAKGKIAFKAVRSKQAEILRNMFGQLNNSELEMLVSLSDKVISKFVNNINIKDEKV